MIWLALLLGCTPPLLPDVAVAALGTQMCAVGHPKAECGQGRVVDQSHGPFSIEKSKDRWIDIAVPYVRKGDEHEMIVRVLVKKLVPCSVNTKLITDDGPSPILLGNPVSSKLVGDAICRELAG